MLITAFLMIIIGLIFSLLGAWPVIGFCGVEFLLLYFLFRLNYRAARGYERVQLNDQKFEVMKIDSKGGISTWYFEPTWLQVHIDNPPEHHSQLTIRSHGRQLTIGKFLTPEERLEVAEAINFALDLRRLSPLREYG